MHVVAQRGRGVVALVFTVVLAAGARPAAAQALMVQVDAAFNTGYLSTTRTVINNDPNADPGDVKDRTDHAVFASVMPGVLLQRSTPRVTWRLGYLFAGALSLVGEQSLGYSNTVNAALITEPSRYTTLSGLAALSSGGNAFLQAQAPAEMGRPVVRAPSDPKLVNGTLGESFSWEVGQRLNLTQGLAGNISAQQDDFSKRNSALTGTLGLDYMLGRDNVGIEASSTVSWLRPLTADQRPYKNVTNTVSARWNHDFSLNLNGIAKAGIEQVYTDIGSRPLAVLPTGSVAARYTSGNIVGVLDVTHGTATNLQVGAVSVTDEVTARGVILLSEPKQRSLSFSAGVLHNEPLGDVDVAVAAATGNAVQADAGFVTAFNKNVLGTARYSLAYQFGQSGGLGPIIVHMVMIGVTASFNTAPESSRKMPRRGVRVDGGDGEGFPVVPSP